MKTIYAVLSTNNEADIIESFCRYTLTYCDGIIINIKETSVDGTAEIVDKLIREGLNITTTDSFKGIANLSDINVIMRCAFERKQADLVLPLDPDEFLLHLKDGNPRTALEALDDNTEYKVKWRTYVYEAGEKRDNSVFLPEYFPRYREPALETYYKTCVSRRLYSDKNGKLIQGKHALAYPEGEAPEIVHHNEMVMAHYPVRSSSQMIQKIIPGQMYYMTKDHPTFHWTPIYQYIKKHGVVEDEQLARMSIEYALREHEIPNGPVQLSDAPLMENNPLRPIMLRYTNYSQYENYLPPVLEEVENLFNYVVSAKMLKVIERVSENNYFCQLYYDMGNGFCEENSLKMPCQPGNNRIFFDTGELPPNTLFRLAPCNSSCIIRMKKAHICGQNNKTRLRITRSNAKYNLANRFFRFATVEPIISFRAADACGASIEIEYNLFIG